MKIKYVIVDLDNTIYPVISIGERLFRDLFDLILKSGAYTGSFEAIHREIMRRPFQYVATEFDFSEELLSEGLKLMNELTYDDPMSTYEDYIYLKNIPLPKILVTVGFTKLQDSKIQQLGIRNDFESCIIIDPNDSKKTKKDIFSEILIREKLNPGEVAIIGDDLNSEIKAGLSLGIKTILYDREKKFQEQNDDFIVIHSMKELEQCL